MKHGKLFKSLTALLAGAMLLATGCTPAKTSSSGTASAPSATSSQEEKTYYNKTGYPICDKPIQISAAGYFAGSAKNFKAATKGDKTNINELKYYYEKLGLDITVDNYTKDAWATALTNMFATDSLPDIVINSQMNLNDINKQGMDGFLVNIMDYQELLPNFLEVCKLYPELKAFSTASNGAIYAPGALVDSDNSDSIYRTFINRYWLTKLNLNRPTTLDEFTDMLKAFRDKDPSGTGENIPLDFTYCRSMTERLLFGAFALRTSDTSFPLHLDANGKVALLDDNYKAYLQYMTMLYDEGLLDKNAYTLSEDESKAQVAANKVGVYSTWAPYLNYNNTTDHDAEEAVGIVSLASKYNNNKNEMVLRPTVSNTARLVISSKSNYIEACVRLLDFIYTEDGDLSTRIGVEGDGFTKVLHDDLLNIDQLDLDESKLPAEYTSTEEWRNSEAVLNNALTLAVIKHPNGKFPNTYTAMLKFFANKPSQADKEKLYNTYGWQSLLAEASVETNTEMVEGYPNMNYGEQSKRRAQLRTDLKNTLTEAVSTTIIGGSANFEANWAKIESSLQGMGLDELLKIEQDTYDAYKANLK